MPPTAPVRAGPSWTCVLRVQIRPGRQLHASRATLSCAHRSGFRDNVPAPSLHAMTGAAFAFRLDCFRESACASVLFSHIKNGQSLGRTTMRRLVFSLAAAIAWAGLAAPASAQQFPDRAIKMIVPWAAGGDTDNIFRPFAPLLQKHIGQTDRHRQRRRRIRHGRRARGQGLGGGRLHALCGARLHPPDLLRRHRRREIHRLRADLPAGGDAVGADLQPQDAVEELAGVRGRRQGAPGPDHGRRHARLHQPHLPGHDREGGGHQAEIRVL